jgi:hypothetical protein
MDRNCWLDLFTSATWKEFQDAGSSINGFRESRWFMAHKIAKGDYFLCYLSDVSRFAGVLEVKSGPFRERSRDIWRHDNFPCRFKVKPIVVLSPEMGIPVSELRDNLSFFQNHRSPHYWANYFRSPPVKWKKEDGDVIVQTLLRAKNDMSVMSF